MAPGATSPTRTRNALPATVKGGWTPTAAIPAATARRSCWPTWTVTGSSATTTPWWSSRVSGSAPAATGSRWPSRPGTSGGPPSVPCARRSGRERPGPAGPGGSRRQGQAQGDRRVGSGDCRRRSRAVAAAADRRRRRGVPPHGGRDRRPPRLDDPGAPPDRVPDRPTNRISHKLERRSEMGEKIIDIIGIPARMLRGDAEDRAAEVAAEYLSEVRDRMATPAQVAKWEAAGGRWWETPPQAGGEADIQENMELRRQHGLEPDPWISRMITLRIEGDRRMDIWDRAHEVLDVLAPLGPGEDVRDAALTWASEASYEEVEEFKEAVEAELRVVRRRIAAVAIEVEQVDLDEI